MRFQIAINFVACFILAQGQVESLFWERAEMTVSPPTCSVSACSVIFRYFTPKILTTQLTCLETIVPQYCGSLTNTTCICTNTQLIAALTPCALAACNITDALQLQRYAAESCGVQNDMSRVYQGRAYYTVPALATCFVAARFFVRIKLDVGLGADDWLMLAALSSYLCLTGTGVGMAVQGFGQHTYWLSTYQISTALMVRAANVLYL
jgi:hypothetical protein